GQRPSLQTEATLHVLGQKTSHGSAFPLFSNSLYGCPICQEPFRFRLSSFSNTFNGCVLTTSSLVNQPLRAIPAPSRRYPACSFRWASQLMTHFTPLLFAYGQSRQSKSNRYGLAFNSIHVPVAAHASMTAGWFTLYGSRSSSRRPVICPRMWT